MCLFGQARRAYLPKQASFPRIPMYVSNNGHVRTRNAENLTKRYYLERPPFVFHYALANDIKYCTRSNETYKVKLQIKMNLVRDYDNAET